jgi:hypothetical protein
MLPFLCLLLQLALFRPSTFQSVCLFHPLILYSEVPPYRIVPVNSAFWPFKPFQVNPIKLRAVCCKLLIQLRYCQLILLYELETEICFFFKMVDEIQNKSVVPITTVRAQYLTFAMSSRPPYIMYFLICHCHYLKNNVDRILCKMNGWLPQCKIFGFLSNILVLDIPALCGRQNLHHKRLNFNLIYDFQSC